MAIINFLADVNEQNVQELLQQVNLCLAIGEKQIEINIVSRGGKIQQGIIAYDTLVKNRDIITVNNLGITDSAAVMIFCSGKVRRCNPNATFLLHSTFVPDIIAKQFDEDKMSRNLKNVQLINFAMSRILATTTNDNKTVFLDMIDKSTELTAIQAQAHNLVNSINSTLEKAVLKGNINILDSSIKIH